MSISKNFIRLSPEYEAEYYYRYNRQPKYIPVDFISNHSLPAEVACPHDYSRVWMVNPMYKKKK